MTHETMAKQIDCKITEKKLKNVKQVKRQTTKTRRHSEITQKYSNRLQ